MIASARPQVNVQVTQAALLGGLASTMRFLLRAATPLRTTSALTPSLQHSGRFVEWGASKPYATTCASDQLFKTLRATQRSATSTCLTHTSNCFTSTFSSSYPNAIVWGRLSTRKMGQIGTRSEPPPLHFPVRFTEENPSPQYGRKCFDDQPVGCFLQTALRSSLHCELAKEAAAMCISCISIY